MVTGRGPEVPDDGLCAPRQQGKTDELVHCPGPDVGGRDVADVAHVEAQQGPELGLGEKGLDPGQPLLTEAIEANPLLPVHAHDAVAVQTHGRPPLVLANDCRKHIAFPSNGDRMVGPDTGLTVDLGAAS